MKQLKKDMRLVLEMGKEIFKLRRELNFSVAKEDFSRAWDLKRRLKELE